MSSDTHIDKKIKILSNKLNLGNFDEVINDAIILLKKISIKSFLIFYVLLIKAKEKIRKLRKS